MDYRIIKYNINAFEHINRGNLQDAEELLLDSISILERLYGLEHPYFAQILSNYCYLLVLRNVSDLAIVFGEHARKIFELSNLCNTTEYYACLNHLGIAYDSIGLRDEAIHFYNIVLGKIKNGDFFENLIQTYSNIGSQLVKREQYQNAISLLLKALEIIDENQTNCISNYPEILNILGLAYIGDKNLEEAIITFERAKNILINSERTNSPCFNSILNNLGIYYSQNEEISKSIDILFELLNRVKETESPIHISNIYDNLSFNYFYLQKFPESYAYALESSKILNIFLSNYAGFIPDDLINQFVSSYRHTIDIIYSILFSWNEYHVSDVITSYNLILKRKCLIYEIDIRHHIVELIVSNNNTDQSIQHIGSIKEKLVRLLYANNCDINNKVVFQEIQDEYNKVKQKNFLTHRNYFNYDEECDDFNYYLIREQIPAHSVLLEFVWYTHITQGKKPIVENRYAVYVLHSQRDIELIELGPAKLIDDIIHKFNTGESNYDEDPSDLIRLGDLIIAPIFHTIKDIEHLIITPDGLLNLLSFAMIRYDNEYLINKYIISYQFSSKDLLQNRKISCKLSSESLIIINPDFNLEDSGPVILDKKDVSLCSNLEGTYHEGNEILGIIGGKVLTGKSASVENFLNMTAPNILHIATHGFFENNLNIKHNSWDSLKRSGLIFAGRNAIIQGKSLPPQYGSGVITAYQISELDLNSTELVVLSACESGMGDTLYSEGVFGLNRSFLIAGAKTIISSLYEVDDKISIEFMKYMYSFIKEGKGKAEALREAQIKHMQKYWNPTYWATYRIFGDSEPLKTPML